MSASHAYRGDETVVLRREFLLEVAQFLKDDPALQMNFLMDLTAVDYSTFGKSPAPAFFASSGVAVSPSSQIPDKDPWPGPPATSRFAVVYHFFSLQHKHRLRLVVPLDEADAEVDSLTSLWAGGELAGARGLGHVRNPLPGTSGPEAHPHVRRVRGPPAAEGLSRQQAPAPDRAGQLNR